MTKQEESRKRTKAALYTVGVNIIVFLILFFAAAWKTAGSGEGEYPGIEVNLGYDDEGSGNIQPKSEPGTPDATDTENAPADPVEDEPKQEIATATPQEEVTAKAAQPATVTDPNSDVEIKEEKVEEKVTEKPVEKKPVVTETPVEKKVVEQPKIDTKAVYKGKTETNPTTSGTGEGKQGEAGSEGDDTGKTGDKGVEGGTEGAAIYKGTPGGGDGGSIVLNGWDWDKIETPKVPENETGRVVFQIEVDENGELIRYRKESGSVSAATERACIASLQKITFTKKPGASVPQVTKGKITFVIRSQ
jgi:periplasmic protein TonB